MEPKDRIWVALDVDSLARTTELVRALAPYVGGFKVGLELLTAAGAPQVVEHVHGLGGRLFLDGKFDDIPNTVAAASRAVSRLGVHMFNVHASAGRAAVRAAVENKGDSLCLAVTVLTALTDEDSREIYGQPAVTKVLEFAHLAREAGADGIVCSPQELEALAREPALRSLAKVTPGIRPAWAAANDQKRTLTPAEALKAGATHLVIGRPITRPPTEIGSPVDAARRILKEVSEVHS